MRHLPIFLELGGKAAVVVGGGVVAARRAEHLVKAGARVTTFATALTDDFRELLDQPNFRHEARDPEPKDFENRRWSASWRSRTNACRPTHGRRRKAPAHWVNVADRPQFCDFIMPSIIDRDPLVIAISTGGASPILGRMLKARLETVHSRRLRPPGRPHGRISRRGGQSDRLAGHAPAILGDRARGTDRRTGARGRRAAPRPPNSLASSNARAPRTPRRRAAKSISSALDPAIPIF